MAIPDHGQELASIDFESMLGGPLIAVVNAQAQAATTTVDFIKAVGFKPGETDQFGNQTTADPIYVTFKYPKEIAPFQAAVAEVRDDDGNVLTEAKDSVPAVYQDMELTVPILTMLPIPFIRVEDATIDFKAKINSIETRKTDRTFKAGLEVESGANFWVKKVSFKASMSFQSTTRTGQEIKRTYSMDVHIRAVQDEIPAGMEKLLGILENAISSQAVGEARSEVSRT